jgi:hypothetical protein
MLADAKFHEQLLVFDRDLSASARAAGCHRCGGALHAALFASALSVTDPGLLIIVDPLTFFLPVGSR